MTAVHHVVDGRTYVLGRHLEPNHDPASRGFPAERASVLKTVSWQHNGQVLNQGQTGSCTGNATVDVLMTDPLYSPARPLAGTEDDARKVYSLATHIDHYPGQWPPDDTGSNGLSAAKAAKRLGLASGYRHAFGLAHTLGALALGPVMVGTPWLQGMFTPGPGGVLDVSGAVAGGHEYALIGLDVEHELVTVLNSWGPTWGINGRAYIGWTDLGRLLSQGGDCTVLVP